MRLQLVILPVGEGRTAQHVIQVPVQEHLMLYVRRGAPRDEKLEVRSVAHVARRDSKGSLLPEPNLPRALYGARATLGQATADVSW